MTLLQISVKSHRGLFQATFPCFIPVPAPMTFIGSTSEINPDPDYNYISIIRGSHSYTPVFTEKTHAINYIRDYGHAGEALVMPVLLPTMLHELLQARMDHGKAPYHLIFDPSTTHEGWQVFLSDFPKSHLDPDANL